MVAALFVLLWSTGFIGAKLGLPHAGPMQFLALRFGIVAAVLWIWVGVSGARRLTGPQIRHQIAVGLLLHVVYLGGIFIAIDRGVEAGLAALIVGLQPAVTAVLARTTLGERLVWPQAVGIALGLAGVTLVVWRKMGDGIGDAAGVAACLIGLLGICAGSLLQKAGGSTIPLRHATAVQFTAATIAGAIAATALEPVPIRWHPEFILALGWSVVVLSLGATTLLFVLIRKGGASDVASLFFLVPPATALIAWPLFGEILGMREIAGLALASLGVLLVHRPGLLRR